MSQNLSPNRPRPGDPNNIIQMLHKGASNQQALMEQFRAQQAQIAQLQQMLDETRRQLDQPQPSSVDALNVPKHGRFYEGDILFEANSDVMQTTSVEISTDGPFIIDRIQMLYQISDPENESGLNGRFVPISSYYSLLYALGRAEAKTVIETNGAKFLPEFTIRLQIEGSGRFWTTGDIPGPTFVGGQGTDPSYLSVPSWIDSKDRIKLEVTPTLNLPLGGLFKATFIGQELLSNITQRELYGYKA